MHSYQINVSRYNHTDQWGHKRYFYLFRTDWLNREHAIEAFDELKQKFAGDAYNVTMSRKSNGYERVTEVE